MGKVRHQNLIILTFKIVLLTKSGQKFVFQIGLSETDNQQALDDDNGMLIHTHLTLPYSYSIEKENGVRWSQKYQ